MIWVVLLSILFLASTEAKGFGPGEQDYGYVTVRDGAHMFWWLLHTTADVSSSTERPLIIQLQGGPGASATGIGNFEILGLLDLNLEPRNTSWVKDYNILLIDNPVGTGYSYVENQNLLAKDNKEVAQDLVALMKAFYKELPQFESVPLYIFGESYGGKFAVDFALLLWKEQLAGKIRSNVKGIGLGDSAIHNVHGMLAWGPMLYQHGLVDNDGLQKIQASAELAKEFYDNGNYPAVSRQFNTVMSTVRRETDGVDVYNVLNKQGPGGTFFDGIPSYDTRFDIARKTSTNNKATWDLTELMNGPVKEALGIPSHVQWEWVNWNVYNVLKVQDFIMPVVREIEEILDTTPLSVVAYNGNLDLICSTPGQMRWIEELKWAKESEYRNAPRTAVWINGLREAYRKTGGGFAFFWINVAGHDPPIDNPAAMREVLRFVTGV